MTIRMKAATFVAALAVAAAFTNPIDAQAAALIQSSLPTQVSSGATQLPPNSTELPACNEVDKQSRALSATDNPQITAVMGGGRKLSYALPGASDEYLTINEPPSGFDPLTASDAELQNWGFPPRPSNAAGLE
jgi:hypothetical protein